jgi:gas vesicle protein
MDLEQLPDRFSQSVAHLRDRTADAVAADGGAVFKELSRLQRQVDGVEDAIEDRLDATESLITSRIDTLIDADRRTTWPRRLFWLAVGAAAGMATAYLADPDRGRSRRAQLSDQVAARTREVSGDVAANAKGATDRAKGQLVEQVKDKLPDHAETDPKLLEQRIKSEVLGHRDDVTQVVLRIDGPGEVALKGTVPTATSERELLASVAEVDGVIDVRSELAVRG